MRTFALFGAKISEFSKFIECPHGQGGEGVELSEYNEDSIFCFLLLGSSVNGSKLISARLLVIHKRHPHKTTKI